MVLWSQVDKREWHAYTDKGIFLLVRQVGNGDNIGFTVKRNGHYLGEDDTLETAQKRAENGNAKSRTSKENALDKIVEMKSPPPCAVERQPKPTRTTIPLTARIVVLKQENSCAPGGRRFAQYDLVKRSATFEDFKIHGGIKSEFRLFMRLGWIELEE